MGSKTQLLDFVYNRNPRVVTTHLCRHRHDFAKQFLYAAAKGAGVLLPLKANKAQICQALQESVGYVNVFTSLAEVWRAGWAHAGSSFNSNLYLKRVWYELQDSSKNPLVQYLLIADKPGLQEAKQLARDMSRGNPDLLLYSTCLRIYDQYYILKTIVEGIATGRGFTFARWLGGQSPPYWVASKSAQSSAHILVPLLRAFFKKTALLLNKVAKDKDVIKARQKELEYERQKEEAERQRRSQKMLHDILVRGQRQR